MSKDLQKAICSLSNKTYPWHTANFRDDSTKTRGYDPLVHPSIWYVAKNDATFSVCLSREQFIASRWGVVEFSAEPRIGSGGMRTQTPSQPPHLRCFRLVVTDHDSTNNEYIYVRGTVDSDSSSCYFHDFPEFLSEYYFTICDLIPHNAPSCARRSPAHPLPCLTLIW